MFNHFEACMTAATWMDPETVFTKAASANPYICIKNCWVQFLRSRYGFNLFFCICKYSRGTKIAACTLSTTPGGNSWSPGNHKIRSNKASDSHITAINDNLRFYNFPSMLLNFVTVSHHRHFHYHNLYCIVSFSPSDHKQRHVFQVDFLLILFSPVSSPLLWFLPKSSRNHCIALQNSPRVFTSSTVFLLLFFHSNHLLVHITDCSHLVLYYFLACFLFAIPKFCLSSINLP